MKTRPSERETNCSQSFKKSTSSSHKKNHFETYHQGANPSQFQQMPRASSKRAEIVKFVAIAGLPFSIVENPNFRFISSTKFSRQTASQPNLKRWQINRNLRSPPSSATSTRLLLRWTYGHRSPLDHTCAYIYILHSIHRSVDGLSENISSFQHQIN